MRVSIVIVVVLATAATLRAAQPSDASANDPDMEGYRQKLAGMQEKDGAMPGYGDKGGDGDQKMPGYGKDREAGGYGGKGLADMKSDGYKKNGLADMKSDGYKKKLAKDVEADGYGKGTTATPLDKDGKPLSHDEKMAGSGKVGEGDQKMPGYGKDSEAEGYGGKDSEAGGYGEGGASGEPGSDKLQKGYGKMFEDMSQKGYGNSKPACPEGTFSAAGKGDEQIIVSEKYLKDMTKRLPEFKLDECASWNKGICYRTCGMSNAECVKSFVECLEEVCQNQNTDDDDLVKRCKDVAQKYKLSGNMVGGMTVEMTQAGCQCLPEAEADAINKKELAAFYQKWAPDQADKVEGLFDKYRTKIPQLMFKLRQKYRESVVIMDEVAYVKQQKNKIEAIEQDRLAVSGLNANNVPVEDEL